MGVTSSGLQSICLLQSCKSQDMNGQASPCTAQPPAKTSTPPHAVSFCDFCLFSFLDTTAADVSDTQEQFASTHPLRFSTRKFNTLFFPSARRFLYDAQRILQFGCGPFRRFCRTTQLFTITFFSDLVYFTTILYAIVWVCKFTDKV